MIEHCPYCEKTHEAGQVDLSAELPFKTCPELPADIVRLVTTAFNCECLNWCGGGLRLNTHHKDCDVRSEIISKPGATITVERMNLTEAERESLSVNVRFPDI